MDVSCQNCFDLKAFKGKGAAKAALEEIANKQKELWREMENLSKETSAVENTLIYIQVHRVPGTKAIQEIRWRAKKRAGDNHVKWNDIESLLGSLPVGTRRYFEEANERLNDFNCLNTILRTTAMRLLTRIHDQSEENSSRKLWSRWVSDQINGKSNAYSGNIEAQFGGQRATAL